MENPFGLPSPTFLNRTIAVEHQPAGLLTAGWDPDAPSLDGTATLVYDLDDPYALIIVFHGAGGDQPWRIPRDVLSRPLEAYLDAPLPESEVVPETLQPTEAEDGDEDDDADLPSDAVLQRLRERLSHGPSRGRSPDMLPGTARARLLPCRHPEHAGGGHVVLSLDLHGHAGTQRVHLDPAATIDFLDVAHRLVPPGLEGEHLDVDGLVAALLGDET